MVLAGCQELKKLMGQVTENMPLVNLCAVFADCREAGRAGDRESSALHPSGVPETDTHHQVLPCHQCLSPYHYQGVA